ncbi:MAG: fused MFS/spermidine synthase [Nocardioidaceae bacterium]
MGIFVGSLVSVGALVAVPLLLLGMVSPYAVRLAMDSVDEAGTTTGRLYAVGTVGSLVGTFAASLLLIPYVGTRRTFLIFACCLVLISLLGAKRRVLSGLAALLVLGLIALPNQVTKTSAEGDRVIKIETEYQYASAAQARSPVVGAQ